MRNGYLNSNGFGRRYTSIRNMYRQVAERAFELGCVAVDAEEHGVGCRFTVGQLEELSRDYGRDAYSVNNPYGRGES